MTEPTNTPQPREIKTPPMVTTRKSLKDNKVLAWLVQNLFYPALFLGALIASSSMTWEVIGIILPGNTFMQWVGMAFYDIGAFVWWLMHVIKARGTNQRAASLLIMCIDLLGAAFMIYADLYLGGQSLATPPAWMGRYLINITTAVMFANLAVGYYYHANSPEDISAADEQDRDDEIEEVTRAQQRAYLEANIHNLAAPMFARSVARFKMRNGLEMTDADYNALEGIIDGQAAPQLPAGNRVTFWDYLQHFFDGALWRRLLGIPSSMTSQPSDSNEPTPPQV
jgi:hypothetical protein